MSTMPVLPLSADEVDRLRVLRHYDILHSLREPVFDEFVALAARLFSLPISLIALVDAEEVEYKANQGLPGLLSQPRVEALCSLAISQHKAVILTDLSTEAPRLTPEAAAAAQAKNLQFYAGVPLRMPDQRDIGTLCVIDHKPRTFSTEEQQLLENIAHLVALTIAVRHCCTTSQELGAAHWHVVQAQLVEEIQALVALVRYLITRFGAQVPVSQSIMEPVQRRLNDIEVLLQEYPTCA
ncbi:MAG: GAF domain-containing protein [Janthinobacterium lividum]